MMIKINEKKIGRKSTLGFTLTEVLIVIGLIAILAGLVIIAINPARQFAQANDVQRASHLNAILNAIGQNIAENKGHFECEAQLDENIRQVKKPASGDEEIDLRPCLVPAYLAELPFDPKSGIAYDGATDTYDTGYLIFLTAEGRITLSAPAAELTEDISVTR